MNNLNAISNHPAQFGDYLIIQNKSQLEDLAKTTKKFASVFFQKGLMKLCGPIAVVHYLHLNGNLSQTPDEVADQFDAEEVQQNGSSIKQICKAAAFLSKTRFIAQRGALDFDSIKSVLFHYGKPLLAGIHRSGRSDHCIVLVGFTPRSLIYYDADATLKKISYHEFQQSCMATMYPEIAELEQDKPAPEKYVSPPRRRVSSQNVPVNISDSKEKSQTPIPGMDV